MPLYLNQRVDARSAVVDGHNYKERGH